MFGPETLDEAAAEFFLWPEEEEAIDFGYQEALFYPWLLFKWMVAPAARESSLPVPRNQTIVHSYLQRRGKKLDALEREYLENFAGAPFSFFEVTAAAPGKSIDLRDLLLDLEYRILDGKASRSLSKGDVVFGSAFTAGGIGLFGALSMITFSPAAKVEILALKDKMSRSRGGQVTAAALEEYGIELRDLYFELFYKETEPPGCYNSDSEELIFHTLEYAIASPQKVFDALKGLTHGFVDEAELLQGAEYDQEGALCKVELPWILPADGSHAGSENTVHGHLSIDGLRLSCEVNSTGRAERLRAVIDEALPGGEATYLNTVLRSAGEIEQEGRRRSLAEGKAEREQLWNGPEVRTNIEQLLRKHWESWPDLELPALRGKTPRQAVQDTLGRQQVRALLEDAEMSLRESNGTLGSMENLEWVRRTLGLEDL